MPDPNNPYFMFQDKNWVESTPAHEKYAVFQNKVREDPDWQHVSDEFKSNFYQQNFGVKDPVELFKSPEAAAWDTETLQRVSGAYLRSIPEYEQIEDVNTRRETRMSFLKQVGNYHRGVQQEIKLFEQQRQAEVMEDQLKRGEQALKQQQEAGIDPFAGERVSPEQMAKDVSTGELSKAILKGLDNLGQGRPALSDKPEDEELSGLGQRAEALYGAAVGGGQRALGGTMRLAGETFNNEWLKEQGEIGSEGGSARYEAFKNGDLDPEKMWQGDLGSTMDLVLQESGPMLLMAAMSGGLGSALAKAGLGGGTGLWASKLVGKIPLIGKSPWARSVMGRTAARVGDAFPFAAVMRVTEGAMEAGGSFEEAILSGKHPSEAIEIANKVLAANTIALGGADLAQTALLFSGMPGGKALNRMIPKNALMRMPMRTAWIAAKLVATGKMEGLEEVQQEEIQAWAKGEGYDLRTLYDPKYAAEKHPEAFNIGQLTSIAMSGPMLTMEQAGREIAGEGLEGPIERGDFDLSGVGQEFGGGVPGDTGPAVGVFEPSGEPAKEPEDVRARDLVVPDVASDEDKALWDTMSDEDKAAVKDEGQKMWHRSVGEQMLEYGLKPEQMAHFPENEMKDLERQAFADAMEDYRNTAKSPETPAEAPEPAPEAEAATTPPEEVVEEQVAPAPAPLLVKDEKPKAKAAKTIEELDALEKNWQENGKPESPAMKKAFENRRKQLEIEAPAEVAEEELVERKVKETKPISELAEDSFVRWTTPDGIQIEGQVRHELGDIGDDPQVGIDDGNTIHYLPPSADVGVLIEYDKPETRKKKVEPKVATPKFGGSEMTIEEWANDYELELGERPSAKKLHDYLTGKITQAKGLGKNKRQVPIVDEPLDVTLRDVKNALKTVEPVEPVEEAKPEAKPDFPAEIAGVPIRQTKKGAANIADMKKAIDAATTRDELLDLEEIEEVYGNERGSVIEKIRKRTDELTSAKIPEGDERVSRIGRESWFIDPDEGLSRGDRVIASSGESSVVVETWNGLVEVDESIAPLVQRLNDEQYHTSFTDSGVEQDHVGQLKEYSPGNGYIVFPKLTEKQSERVRSAAELAGMTRDDRSSQGENVFRIPEEASGEQAKKMWQEFETFLFPKSKPEAKPEPEPVVEAKPKEKIEKQKAEHAEEIRAKVDKAYKDGVAGVTIRRNKSGLANSSDMKKAIDAADNNEDLGTLMNMEQGLQEGRKSINERLDAKWEELNGKTEFSQEFKDFAEIAKDIQTLKEKAATGVDVSADLEALLMKAEQLEGERRGEAIGLLEAFDKAKPEEKPAPKKKKKKRKARLVPEPVVEPVKVAKPKTKKGKAKAKPKKAKVEGPEISVIEAQIENMEEELAQETSERKKAFIERDIADLRDDLEEAVARSDDKVTRSKKKGRAPAPPTAAVPEPEPVENAKPAEDSVSPPAEEDFKRDKNGAAVIADLKDMVTAATTKEELARPVQIYAGDMNKGRRKRKSGPFLKLVAAKIEELEELEAVGEVDAADARQKLGDAQELVLIPKVGYVRGTVKKAEDRVKKKESTEESAARMKEVMDAPWEWAGDESIEDELAFLGGIESDGKLAAEVYNEILSGWKKINGIPDVIDPTFVDYVLREAEKINPAVTDIRERVVKKLKEGDVPLYDSNRNLRQFLFQEYPGTTTLKEATGDSVSEFEGSPTAAFVRWLRLGVQEVADEKRGVSAMSVAKQSRQKSKQTAQVEKLKEPGEEPTPEEVKEAAEEAKEEGIIEEGEKLQEAEKEGGFLKRAAFGERIFRSTKVPTAEEVKKSFPSKYWDWDSITIQPDGFIIKLKDSDKTLEFKWTKQVDEILYDLKSNKEYLAEQRKRFKIDPAQEITDKALEVLAKFITAEHTRVSSQIEETGALDSQKEGVIASYRRIGTHHIIAIDSKMGDRIALIHEAVHFGLRNFFTDQQLETAFKALKTEENIAVFFSLAIANREDAMQFADSLKVSDKNKSFLGKMVDKMEALFSHFADALGVVGVKSPSRLEMIKLAEIADMIQSGEIWGQEQAVPYEHGELLYRLDRTLARGRINYSYNEMHDLGSREVIDQHIPEDVSEDPLPLQQDEDTHQQDEGYYDPTALEARQTIKTRSRRKKFKQLMRSDRGVPKELRDIMLKRDRESASGKYLGQAVHDRLKKMVKTLKGVHGEERVENALSQVLDGRMPIEQFARIYNLDIGNGDLASLQTILDEKVRVQQLLAENPSLPMSIRQTINENEFYQTRMYAIHVLGNAYVAPDQAYVNAIDQVMEKQQEEMLRVLARANVAIGVRDPFDLPAYLYGNEATKARMLEGISDTKKVAIERTARAMSPWLVAIQSMQIENGSVVPAWNAQTLRELARMTVDGYLSSAALKGKGAPGPIGGMPITHQLHRKLDNVFRELFGEIQNPAERAARTMEVQHDLLASGVMFQRIYEEGENIWWNTNRQGEFTEKLTATGGKLAPGDKRKYGNMAGKYVTQETYDLIHQQGVFEIKPEGPLTHAFQTLQGTTRATRLIWPKTVLRNGFTAVAGFSFRSGDALYPEYWKHYAKGTRLMARLMWAQIPGVTDPEATEILADLVARDVFDVTQESSLQAIQANLRGVTDKSRAPMRGLQKAMQAYGLIDLPAKYASYKTMLDQGMSEAEAVDHVHRFYQYKDSVPEMVTKLNRYGFGDYFGYTYDSTRIWLNSIAYAATEAKKGNVRPAFGLLMSTSIPAFRYGSGGWVASLAPTALATPAAIATETIGITAGNLLALLGLKDDDDELERRIATDEEVSALRKTLASYDRYMPLAAWYERERGTEKWTLKYQVLGNTSAFPIEDVVLGAWQASSADPNLSFTRAIGRNAVEASPMFPGMAWENVYKLATGSSLPFGGNVWREKGIFDAIEGLQTFDEDTPVTPGSIGTLGDRAGEYIGNTVLFGQSYNMALAALEVARDRAPRKGRYIKRKDWKDVEDVMSRLVRKYDVEPEDQERLLSKMLQNDLKVYKEAKYRAGTAGRSDQKWEDGSVTSELLTSERGKDAWHQSLKGMQNQVNNFRVLTKDSFTDAQLVEMLDTFSDLRKDELYFVVGGTVDDMTVGDFEIKHTPQPGQRGDSMIMEYFDEVRDKGDTVKYRELYDRVKAEGLLVGEFPTFRRRAKTLREGWHKRGKQ